MTVTLHFKMLGHQPSAVKRVQPWLAWAISCYWNLLYKQSLLKLHNQEKWFTIQSTIPQSFCVGWLFGYFSREKWTCSSLLGELGRSIKSLHSESQVAEKLRASKGTGKGLNSPSHECLCVRAGPVVPCLLNRPLRLLVQRLEHSPAIFFFYFIFSLGKLEGTGILKFADKSEKKTERSYSK